MRSLRIRSGRGLGDSLYLQAIVRHLIKQGKAITALTDYHDVFCQLPCNTEKFSRIDVDILAHYSTRKSIRGTSQFQDCCITAGIKEEVELAIDWNPQNQHFINSIEQLKPFVVVQMPREPMNRRDGFGMELLPDLSKIQLIIDEVKKTHNVIQMGHGKRIYKYNGIDLDLCGKTSVKDLMDLASVASGFIGHCSFMNPLAECFGKPSLTVWSRRGLRSRVPYIKQITPEKICHKENSKHVIDKDPDEIILETANAFLR